jgi:hypothetical protein
MLANFEGPSYELSLTPVNYDERMQFFGEPGMVRPLKPGQ